MDNDPNQPQSSSSGQQPPSQSDLPQEPPLYESPPHWRQQPLPQYRQPPYGSPQYGGSPIPTNWPPQPPKKRSSRWPWIILAILAGLLALCCISAIFVTLSIGSFVGHVVGRGGPLVPCLLSEVPTTGSSIGSPTRQAGPVTTLNDNGQGSLRQAIAMAPSKSAITFDPSLRGTILLTSGDLNIAKDLTIRGPGAGILSISGGKSGHLVCVLGASVTISGLTFENSKTAGGLIVNNGGTLTLNNSTVSGNTASGSNVLGGGIFNQGTLTLNNSTVSGNTATDANVLGGGIENDGTLTLNNSTVSGNTATDANVLGGGIFNGGTLTLTNSTVSGNTGTSILGTGGIYSNGTLTLTNSTVSGNTAAGLGGAGGILNDYGGTLTLTNSTVSGNTSQKDGGGIFNTNAKFTLTNSTISDNKASSNGGGIAISDDTSSGQTPSLAMLLYCTVYSNTAGVGGGIWVGNQTQGQMITIGASIVAGNNAHPDPDIVGSLTSLGYNLVGDRSGATFLGSPKVQSTDVLGVSLTNLGIDPKLRDNGGSAKPHTWTHALLPGSPAIDLIPPEACMMFKVFNDQRGVKRLQGKGCDSGAYE